jgi:hypothetical protein
MYPGMVNDAHSDSFVYNINSCSIHSALFVYDLFLAPSGSLLELVAVFGAIGVAGLINV